MINNIIRELFQKGYNQKEIVLMIVNVGHSKEEAISIMNRFQKTIKGGN